SLVSSTQNIKGKNIGKFVKRNRSVFSITPFFSPDFAWYHLQNDNVGLQPGSASQLEKEEKHEFSYTFGVLGGVSLNKHLALESGITVANTKISLEPQYIY